MAEDNSNYGNAPHNVSNPNPDSGQNENQEAPADNHHLHHQQQQQPDLGLGQSRHTLPTKRPSQENQGAGASMDPPKREENPFSFKHFLNRDACNGGQNTGAKPKVYTSPSFPDASFGCSDYSQNSSARNLASNPEMASALPDFVQDHLVVEQCYLRDSGPSNIAVAIENLPDFAVNRDCNSPMEAVGGVSPPTDDFKSYLRNGPSRSRNSRVDNVPLDLPNFDLRSPAVEGIPFDLPRVDGGSVVGANGGQADVTQPSVSKSLPDFLSDGPIRGGHLNSSQPPDSTTMDFPEHFTEEQRLQAINENLRRNIESLRSAYDDQCKRISALYAELRAMRSKESEDSKTLEKALSQVEDNLKRCTRRAVSAENTVTRLKQEVKSLSTEIAHLQRENWELQGGAGASGPSTSYASSSSTHQTQMQRYAQELKIAASSAETSLRQLLSGVDNLRVIASSMETLHRIEDRTKDFLPDSDDSAGPAL